MDRTKQIVELHEQILASMRRSLRTATEIGKLLADQKAELNHGEWESWVRDNLPFSVATARNYRKLYAERNRLKSLNVSEMAEAYRFLYGAKPKADKGQGTDASTQAADDPPPSIFPVSLPLECENEKQRANIERYAAKLGEHHPSTYITQVVQKALFLAFQRCVQ